MDDHAPFDAPMQRAVFVGREVVPGSLLQQRDDVLQGRDCQFRWRLLLVGHIRVRNLGHVFQDAGRQLGGRGNDVAAARGDGASGH